MADQPQSAQDEKKAAPPKGVGIPEPKQMSLWDSFMLILRPDTKR
jgi:hypothetical protein